MSRFDSISVDREVRWKSNILFNKKTIAEMICGSDADVLRSDFRSCRDPNMANTEPGTCYACVVDGTVGVAVSDYEDVLSGEGLQGGLKCVLHVVLGFVVGDDQGCFCCSLLVGSE